MDVDKKTVDDILKRKQVLNLLESDKYPEIVKRIVAALVARSQSPLMTHYVESYQAAQKEAVDQFLANQKKVETAFEAILFMAKMSYADLPELLNLYENFKPGTDIAFLLNKIKADLDLDSEIEETNKDSDHVQ
jgi:hypothetical protein